MKKIWNFILKYRIYLVLLIFIIIAIFVGLTLKSYLDPVDETVVWGNRLNGREEVPITDTKIKEIEDFIKEDENVTKTSVRVVGNIIKIIIITSKDDTLDKMQKLGDTIISKFSEKEVKYYEFGFSIKNEDKNYVMVGEKKNSNESISWVHDEFKKSEVEVNEEKQ